MALARYGSILTDYEKSELSSYEEIYTIGKVRREGIYKLADREGYYIVEEGE